MNLTIAILIMIANFCMTNEHKEYQSCVQEMKTCIDNSQHLAQPLEVIYQDCAADYYE